ncbi:MAG: hypothetical protein ACREEE_06970 [Dongiaceae bacterium]
MIAGIESFGSNRTVVDDDPRGLIGHRAGALQRTRSDRHDPTTGRAQQGGDDALPRDGGGAEYAQRTGSMTVLDL